MTISFRVLRRVVVVATATTAFAAAPVAAQLEPPNSDYDVEHRDLLVVDAAGRTLDGGGGLTAFGVELEGEDECPGDSTHEQYRVDSYMVPLAVDPTELEFAGAGPHPPQFRDYETFQMPLEKVNGTAFAAELTGDQTTSGGPGPIRDIPPFDFHVYVPTSGIDDWEGGVPAGAYRIGVACTFNGRITNLWETTIEVTEDPADEPVAMRWTVTGPQPRELETAPSEPTALIVSLIGVAGALLVAAIVLHRSSKRRATSPSVTVPERSIV